MEDSHMTDIPSTKEPRAVDHAGIRGTLTLELRDEHGELKHRQVVENLITQVGDQMYGERGAALGTLAAPTGMRYGTGTTAASKTGAGAAIVTYVTGSNAAFDGGFPTSGLSGASRRITYQSVWAAGVATSTAIAEFVVTNESPLTNVAGTAANTVSRVVVTPFDKAAGDSLTVTWTHDLLGA
jgi:hypothetical protein